MSGWRSKKQMGNDKFGISCSWTQSYPGWSKAFTRTDTSIVKELAVIEAIDRLVEKGLIFPEADATLKTIVNNFKE